MARPADLPDAAVGGRELRKVLSRFVTGVTVVTTACGDEVHGMTANSFTAVSLEPPLVLVSVATAARMDELIPASGRYGVSILSAEQQRLSLHFAGLCEHEQLPFAWRAGVPVIEGALAHLACTVTDSHPAGDHTLHVGRVDDLWYGNGDPLVFYTGSYRALSIEPDPVWVL
jgi:flavin reductase (DIM6/NTAB) family NADH-FMN oxidoreductase RutF